MFVKYFGKDSGRGGGEELPFDCFGIIWCPCLKMACNLKMASHGAKHQFGIEG